MIIYQKKNMDHNTKILMLSKVMSTNRAFDEDRIRQL